jgi:hypothetical protein
MNEWIPNPLVLDDSTLSYNPQGPSSDFEVIVVINGKRVTPENATLAEARAIVRHAEAFK